MLVEAELERTMATHAARMKSIPNLNDQQFAEAIILDRRELQMSKEAEEAPIPGSWKGSRLNREERVLADLIQHPEEIDQLPAWLNPASFSADARRHLYEALATVHSRGEPVDTLTVAWELDRIQRDSSSATGGVDPIAYLDRLAALPVEPGTATHLARDFPAVAAPSGGADPQKPGRLAQPRYGPGTQQHGIGRHVGRYQRNGAESRRSPYRLPSPGIERKGPGPRLGH